MTTFTYKDLDLISDVLLLVLTRIPPREGKPYEHALEKVLAAMKEVEGIEPKPQFKLTHEGEQRMGETDELSQGSLDEKIPD